MGDYIVQENIEEQNKGRICCFTWAWLFIWNDFL